jgi:hypothetical protein
MRNHPRFKSIIMVLALPMAEFSSAEAQVRSGRDVSRPAGASRANRANVNRSHVNRSHVRSDIHRGRPVVRHHPRPATVVVVHPHRRWSRGGAIAAGAAIGFIAGASAVAIAGSPPRSGYCWFYTTPQRTTGFWDWCPR